MQKRAARIILGAEYMTRMVTMFNKLNWIPYYNEAYISRCGIAFKRINDNTQPNYITEILGTNSDVHTRNTRYCNLNFICPHYNKASDGGRTFTVRTIKNWNNLDIIYKKSGTMDRLPYRQKFLNDRNSKICYHSLKDHPKVSKIAKFRCEML